MIRWVINKTDFIREQTLSLLRSYNPIWLFDDLNGKICDDTFYLYTLENTLPYLPQNIWRDSSGVVPWSNPIQFLANGTLPDNMYWDDSLVYRLEIRQNDGSVPPSQADALIYEVNNYIPGTGAQIVPGSALSVTDNQITNPQFQIVNFTGTLSIATAGTVEIAPGWSVITTGAGNLTVTQFQQGGNVYTGTNQSNASTGITLENNGFSTVTLRQRFNGNGALWTGAAVSGGVTASSFNGVTLSMDIRYSNVTTTNIISQALTTSNTDYIKSVPISPSTSAILPSLAWTDIDLSFNINTTVSITSVQLIGESSVLPIKYLQTTPERQIDETFHYYNLPLQYKPISSYLVGWDFPYNPAQAGQGQTGTLAALGANKSQYIWDQTIAFQSIANSLTFTRATNGGLQIGCANNTSFALIQYLDATVAKEMLSQRLSVQLQGLVSSGSLTGTVSLYWTSDATLPVLTLGTDQSLVSSITSGVPAVTNGTWNIVANNTFGNNAPFTLTANTTTLNFTNFDASTTLAKTTAKYFAIVVCLNTLSSANTVRLNYCSVVPGDIATRPAPQTFSQVLDDCEYFFEKSYQIEQIPGTVSSGNALTIPMNLNPTDTSTNITYNLWAAPWNLIFKNIKRTATPIITIYPTVAPIVVNTATFFIDNAAVTVSNSNAVTSVWTINFNGARAASFIPNSTGNIITSGGVIVGNRVQGYMACQYTVDARLGLV
jgi:hypothetical protein